MKRWFSLLLALALACVQMSGPMARAFAEESTPEVPSAAKAIEVCLEQHKDD